MSVRDDTIPLFTKNLTGVGRAIGGTSWAGRAGTVRPLPGSPWADPGATPGS